MKCKDCNNLLCSHRTTDAEKECVYSSTTETPNNSIDFSISPELEWELFRREAAKDIFCAMLNRPDQILKHFSHNLIVKNMKDEEMIRMAVERADALIEELRK